MELETLNGAASIKLPRLLSFMYCCKVKNICGKLTRRDGHVNNLLITGTTVFADIVAV